MTSHDADRPPAPPSDWVRHCAKRIPVGGRVLDLACGRGRHTRLLLEQGFAVVAIDRDVSSLADLGGDARVTVIEADLEVDAWPLEGETFDAVVVTNYLYRPRLVALVDLLAPNALLIYETFTKGHEVYGRPRNPHYLLEPNELRETYAPYLAILAHEEHLDSPPALRQRLLAQKRSDHS